MILQSAFAAGAGAVEVGAGAAAVGAGMVAGVVAVADGQGVAEVTGATIAVEVPAGAGAAEALLPAPAEVAPAAAGDVADVADVADPAEAGVRQGFAGAAVLAEASSMVLTCGVMTAAIPAVSTTARSPIISAERARGGCSSWLL